MTVSSSLASPASLVATRYTIFGEIASGGMATIRYARLIGAQGFSRAVAIKQLHPQFAKDQNFVSMILDEARLSARIAHANVVQTIDVLSEPGELAIVMEYVHGESLGRVLGHLELSRGVVPVRIAVTLVTGILHGLQAAHETRGEHGEPLHIVHRDVSPENILVGSDGIARLIDFGVARAQGRSRVTPAGELKGKLAYMACEQYRGEEIDRRVDVYGASVVLWETLAGRDLFKGESDAAVVGAVMEQVVKPPSEYAQHISPELDAIVMQGLSRDRTLRFATAREMAIALERSVGLSTQSEVSDWLESVAGDLLLQRVEAIRRMQRAAESRSQEALGPAITRRLDARASTPPAAPERVSAGLETDSRADEPRVVQAAASARPSSVRPRGPSQRPRAWVLVALAVCVALGAWLVSRQQERASELAARNAPAVQRAPTGGAQAPAELKVLTLPASAAPTTAVEPVLDAATKQDLGRTSEAATVGALTAPSRERPERSKVRRERASPKSKAVLAAECAQPFWLDARGIRHVKRECLD